MTSSGTVGSTLVTVDSLIAKAVRRCGKKSSEITPEWADLGRESLFFFLSGLGARGINFWRQQRQLIPIVANRAEYPLPVGTLDVMNVLWRTMNYPGGGTPFSNNGGNAADCFDGDHSTFILQTIVNGNIGYDFGPGVIWNLSTWGFMPTDTRIYNIVLEVSDDMTTWTVAVALPEASYPAGQMQLFDLTEIIPARAFRIRETVDQVLSMTEVVFAQNPLEIPMADMNRDIYSSLPNKGFTSPRSLQFWFDRQRDQPKIVLWPVPSDGRAMMQVYKHIHIEDPGELSNTLDVPLRWYPAVMSNLTYQMGLELPDVDPNRLIQVLKPEADAQLKQAEDDEYGRGPIFLAPNIGPYTV